MEGENFKSLSVSMMLSLILVSIINAAITIGKEISADFKGFFVLIAGHHWVGHGIVIMLLFIVFGVLGYFLIKGGTIKLDMNLYKLALITMVIMVLTDIVILASYLFH